MGRRLILFGGLWRDLGSKQRMQKLYVKRYIPNRPKEVEVEK
jgi:hypothetical protein